MGVFGYIIDFVFATVCHIDSVFHFIISLLTNHPLVPSQTYSKYMVGG